MKANQINQFSEYNIQTEIENIYRILNKIGFGTLFNEKSENLDAFLIQVTANSVTGDDTSITHDLKRIPQGYLILSQHASGGFYEGTGINTETLFFIKCSTASVRFKIAII